MAGEQRHTAVADLQVWVYARPLHPEFFEIRDRRALVQGRAEAEVWLLEKGHVITLVEGQEALSEVVAPRELSLPKRGLLRTTALAGERDERIATRGPLVYHMAYQVDVAGPADYLREAEELLGGARTGHLFSESGGESAAGVFAYAVPELTARSLVVHTWHGFPAAHTILRTQTLIERGGR